MLKAQHIRSVAFLAVLALRNLVCMLTVVHVRNFDFVVHVRNCSCAVLVSGEGLVYIICYTIYLVSFVKKCTVYTLRKRVIVLKLDYSGYLD